MAGGMRSLFRRLGSVASIVLAGGVLNLAVFEALRASPEKLALFAAAAIAAEALQRVDDELLPDALQGERFTLAAPIQIAAILVAGPWVAAAVAGWSMVGVGFFRDGSLLNVLRRAAAVAVAALAGGVAFGLAAGVVGQLHLPDDLLPAALA